ncbi:MAG TPA: DNA topoisomerase IB, partial [Puia sp.]|nr:DNA topoisomerase IB [Puia sp.]
MDLTPALSHSEFLRADRDYEKAAVAANLVYVSDRQPGIIRKRKGKGFTYLYDSKTLKDKAVLQRIRKLVLPPAWENVWICPDEKGHIQATGYDVRKRKQYKYHHLWHALRSETKFHRLYEFGKALPQLRTRLDEDLG